MPEAIGDLQVFFKPYNTPILQMRKLRLGDRQRSSHGQEYQAGHSSPITELSGEGRIVIQIVGALGLAGLKVFELSHKVLSG